MDQERDYLNAICPATHFVLGQELEPLSIGHICLLKRFDNAWICAKERFSKDHGELIQAAYVCSHGWETLRLKMRGQGMAKELEEWGRMNGPTLMDPQISAFKTYLEEGLSIPFVLPMESQEETRAFGGSLLLRLRIFYQRQGLSFGAAMDVPFARANWDYFGWLESEGRARIANSQELLEMEEHSEEAESEGMLRACLAALPGAMELGREGGNVTAKNAENTKGKRKGGGNAV